jgi:hypothetical protein
MRDELQTRKTDLCHCVRNVLHHQALYSTTEFSVTNLMKIKTKIWAYVQERDQGSCMSLITVPVQKGKQNPLSVNKAGVFRTVMGLSIQAMSEKLEGKALM